MESPTNVLGVTTFVLNQVVLRDIWECTLGGNPKVGLMQKIKLKITTAPSACSRILGDLSINQGYKGRFFKQE